VEGHAVILLDTHALIWMMSNSTRLSRTATTAIRSAAESDSIAVSAITLWELAWLANAGRVTFSGSIPSFVERMTARTVVLPLTAEIAVTAVGFSDPYPNDPADRLIGATAVVEGISLVTKDANIRRSGFVKTVW
jgi:PIN domain nuclease of toxin-antitoxin system